MGYGDGPERARGDRGALATDPGVGSPVQEPPVDPDQSVTSLQREFSRVFVEWMRGNDLQRSRIEPVLDLLGKAVRKARPRSGG